MSDKLDKLRARIDALDDRMLDLLTDRARAAQEIGHIKQGVKYRPEREAQVLRRITARNAGPLSDRIVARLYTEIMSACRALEDGITVAYLGPPGTFSEEAAIRQFGSHADRRPSETIDEVFRLVEAGGTAYGVVPIENSTEGSIARTHDLLLTTPLKICGEVLLPVHHCLMSRSGNAADIKKVYSHGQSFAQCHEWLNRRLAGVKRTPVVSNAEAARRAAKDASAAAIAGRSAADLYELKLIATNIEDEPQNTTRFVVIGAHETGPSGRDKTSLVMSARNVPGAMHALLSPLAEHGVSMTRLESRPARTGLWEYVFYVDLEGHRVEPRLGTALNALAEKATMLKILGSYPSGIA